MNKTYTSLAIGAVLTALICGADAKPEKTTNPANIQKVAETKAEPDQSGWADLSVPDRRTMLILIHLLKVEYPGLSKEQLMTKLVAINTEAKKDWADINWSVVLP